MFRCNRAFDGVWLKEQRARLSAKSRLSEKLACIARHQDGLKHVVMIRRTVFQDAREIRTERTKTFTSDFFPTGPEIEDIVIDWIHRLRTALLFGDDDPVFPATRVALNVSLQFHATGLYRRHWSNAVPIRRIFRVAFAGAGLPYYNPLSFRRTLAPLPLRLS